MIGNIARHQHLRAVKLLLHAQRGISGGIGIAAFAAENIRLPRSRCAAEQAVALDILATIGQAGGLRELAGQGAGVVVERIIHITAHNACRAAQTGLRPQIGARHAAGGARFVEAAHGNLHIRALLQTLFD